MPKQRTDGSACTRHVHNCNHSEAELLQIICCDYADTQLLQCHCTACASPGMSTSAAKAWGGMGSAPTEPLYCVYQSRAAAASNSRLCQVAASCWGQAASDSQGKSALTVTSGLQAAGPGVGRSANCCCLCAVPPLGSGHGGGHGQDADALQEPYHVPSSSNVMLLSLWRVPAPHLLTAMVRQPTFASAVLQKAACRSTHGQAVLAALRQSH